MKLILPSGREFKFFEGSAKRADPALTIDQYLAMSYQGIQYALNPGQTLQGKKEDISSSFLGYVQGAYKSNGVVWACMLARLMLFSEARFQWRRLGTAGHGRPQDLWGSPELSILETPWPNAITGDLLTRAIQDVDLAGNFYALRRNGQIRRLRPDWVTIILGSLTDPDAQNGDLNADLLGYLFHPGGPAANRQPVPLLVEEVAHFAPIPDPIASYRGMSWITPMIREVEADIAATQHKLSFFNNGATVNQIVSLDPSIQQEAFDKWIKVFRTQHEGAMNAYRTLYLGGGATVTAVGSNFQQMDFKVTQGAGETRIAAAAGVPPVIVGLSEGLSAATYSNYAQARRRFADGTIRPLWRNLCGSLATILNVPGGSELWYDDRDIAFLREDRKDVADIQSTEAGTITSLISAGFRPDTVVDAVLMGDLTQLVHTGMYSVQLQPPGLPAPNPTPPLGEGVVESPQPSANGSAKEPVTPSQGAANGKP